MEPSTIGEPLLELRDRTAAGGLIVAGVLTSMPLAAATLFGFHLQLVALAGWPALLWLAHSWSKRRLIFATGGVVGRRGGAPALDVHIPWSSLRAVRLVEQRVEQSERTRHFYHFAFELRDAEQVRWTLPSRPTSDELRSIQRLCSPHKVGTNFM